MDSQFQPIGQFDGLDDHRKCLVFFFRCNGITESACMDFHLCRMDLMRQLYLFRIRIYKNTGRDPGLPELGNRLSDIVLLRYKIQSAFGGQLFAFSGTSVTRSGIISIAMPIISEVAAIPRINLVWTVSRSSLTSRSWM